MQSPLLQLPPASDQHENEQIRQILSQSRQKLGFVPNMYRTMANAPHLLESYLFGYDRFRSQSGFNKTEQEVVLLTISSENNCHYCLAAHSTLADKISDVPPEVTDAIREKRPVTDPELAALSQFTRQFVQQKGELQAHQLESFLAAGYSQQHVLDILLAIAVKTISNYANHLFATPLDDIFAGRAVVTK